VLILPATTFEVVKTSQLRIEAEATDKDRRDTLTFSLVGAPAGAAIHPQTGLFTWTPTEDQGPASYTFQVRVTDNGWPPRFAQKSITVHTRAVGLVEGNLLVVGTSGPDIVAVRAAHEPAVIKATVNGVTSGPFVVPSEGRILVRLFAGADSVTLDEAPVPVGPPTTVEGGLGADQLVVNGTPDADSFGITAAKVSLTGAGDITYPGVEALTVNTLGGADQVAMTGLYPATATTINAGTGIDAFTGSFAGFTGNLALAGFESAAVTVTGDFTGQLAVGDPGVLQPLVVTGTVTAGSVITATRLANVQIGTLAGTLTAVVGRIEGVSITTIAATGLLQVTEDLDVPGSGLLADAVLGTVHGRVVAGAIVRLQADRVAPGGSILAAGQGTTDDVSIGTLEGSFTAPEDENPGSGVMTDTTIDSIGPTGVVSTGHISGMTIGIAEGAITAEGQGTTDDVSIGILDGSFTAPEDANPGSGVMSDTTIDSIGPNGVVSTGHISGMTIGIAEGAITAEGQGTTDDVSIGTLDGSFTAPEDANPGSGVMTDTTIDSIGPSGVVSTGHISG
jgi:hypothetical protein